MIESTKFKKMLHILKNNAKDLNIDISVVDYDTAKECDYEVITLHLKETNTQNGAVVYKDFVIRSQLYYDAADDKYYSALDGDIIVKDGAFSKINIITTITEITFQNDNINIQVQLIDSDTQEPLKNQPIYMYLSGTPDESIMSATTNKEGRATFSFHLSNIDVSSEERIMYFEYKGNNTHRGAISDYITINLGDVKEKNIESSITTYITPTENLIITYNIAFDGTNLIDGFRKYTTLSLNESDILAGKVLFYAEANSNKIFLGEGTLVNGANKTYSSIVVPIPQGYYNQDVDIQAIFEGNNLFSSNTASLSTRFDRITPTNINLDVIDNEDGFSTRLSFDIDSSLPSGELYETGLDSIYRLYGQVLFYVENANSEWGTADDNLPFYIANNFSLTQDNNTYTISTETDSVLIDLNHYLLSPNDNIYIKAVYQGNAIINNFDIDNKPRQTR